MEDEEKYGFTRMPWHEVKEKLEGFFRDYCTADILEASRGYPDVRSVEIDFGLLVRYDYRVAENVLFYPATALEAASRAMAAIEKPTFERISLTPRWTNLPETAQMSINQIRDSEIGRFLEVEGTIQKASSVLPRLVDGAFSCENCGHIMYVHQPDEAFRKPDRCESCEKKATFGFLEDQSEWTSMQKLLLQESPEALRGGESPRQLPVHLEDDLAGLGSPGDRIAAAGVLKVLKGKKMKGQATPVFKVYLEANNIKHRERGFEEIEISREDVEKIREFSGEEDLYEVIRASIAPHIFGHEEIKEAIMYQLFSSPPIEMPGGSRIRGDSHILLIGDPSCQPAGSQVLMGDGTWKEIQDIRGGDLVMSPQRDGNVVPVRVTETFAYAGCDTYRVEVKNKNKGYLCSYNHIIPLLDLVRYQGKRDREERRLEFWYTQLAELTAEEVQARRKDDGRFREKARIFSTPAYDLPPKRYDVHPYVMGCMLGNGCFSDSRISFRHHDTDVIRRMEDFGAQFGKKVWRKGSWDLTAVKDFARTIKAAGLVGKKARDKCIPPEYMRGSLEQRKWLLAGLIDTDGTAEEFSSASYQLARGFADLVFSIGGWATLNQREVKFNGEKFTSYRVYYSAAEHKPPVQCNHKRRYINLDCKHPRNHSFTVRYHGKDRVYGFKLERGSQWYVTDGWLVTHNTGKSEMLEYVARELSPKGISVSGRGASGAGLVAAAVKDEFGEGSWSLEAGALALADGGHVSADEFEKMDNNDRNQIHGALEQQRSSINKAGMHATFNTRCTVLAAANPKHGRFDDYKPLSEQVALDGPILSRFDMIFFVRDDLSETREVARHILESATRPEKIVPGTDPEFLRKYIAYARQNISPELSGEAREAVEEFYVKAREKAEQAEDLPVPLTARQLWAAVRLARARARARLSSVVTREDAEKAIELINKSLRQAGLDLESGEVDIDKIYSGTTKSQRDRIRGILLIIQELEEEYDTAKKDEVVEMAREKGINKDQTLEIIEKLKNQGDVFEPKFEQYKIT